MLYILLPLYTVLYEKSYLMNLPHPPFKTPMLHIPNRDCWWPGDVTSQGITSFDIDFVLRNISVSPSEKWIILRVYIPMYSVTPASREPTS